MANWHVGIDESGSFEYYKSSGKHSFVCAVISKNPPDMLKEKFANIFYMMNGRPFASMPDLLDYFHAMERSENDNQDIFGNLKDEVYKVVVSHGRPLVLCNPQHWWLSGVMSVLHGVLSLDEINVGDTIEIHLGTRGVGFIGVPKENGPSWLQYHQQLQSEVLRWIKSIDKKCLNIRLACKAAGNSCLVTLADQAVGMYRKKSSFYLNDKLQKIECSDFYEMINKQSVNEPVAKGKKPRGNPNELACREFMEGSDYLTALQFWLRAFFAKESIPIKFFSDIMSGAFAEGHTYAETWKLVLDTCEYALDNRGDDPLLIDRVFRLQPELESEHLRIGGLTSAMRQDYGIDIQLLMQIWRVFAKISTHHGDTHSDVLNFVDAFWNTDSQEIGSTLERWKFYLQTKLIGAQIPFNAYDFACIADRMEPLLDCHEKLFSLPFPFTNASVDNDYAALLGTFGQAAAFQGNLEEAKTCFEEDYAYSSPDWKPMPASFMVTVLLQQRDFEAACEWFKKQTGGVSFEDFGKTLSSKSDLWQVVNYFKLLSLAVEDGLVSEQNIPDIEEWNINNSYPWPLVLKWFAFIMYRGEDTTHAVDLLNKSCMELSKGGFAIRTLALSVMQMLYCITGDEQVKVKYENTLRGLSSQCATFKSYVAKNAERFELKKDRPLWDAAMMLPFNYS